MGATGDDDGYNSAGACYIVMLTTSGTVTGVQKISNSQGASLDDSQSAYFGKSVASLELQFRRRGRHCCRGVWVSVCRRVHNLPAAPPTPVPTTSPLPTPIPTTAFRPRPRRPLPDHAVADIAADPAPTSLSPTSAPVKAPGDRDDSSVLSSCFGSLRYRRGLRHSRSVAAAFPSPRGTRRHTDQPTKRFRHAPVITQMVEVSDASKTI